jgi:hypothetical protein
MNTRIFVFIICHIICLILLFLVKAVSPLGIIAFLINLADLIYDVIVIATQEEVTPIIQKIKRLNEVEKEEKK